MNDVFHFIKKILAFWFWIFTINHTLNVSMMLVNELRLNKLISYHQYTKQSLAYHLHQNTNSDLNFDYAIKSKLQFHFSLVKIKSLSLFYRCWRYRISIWTNIFEKSRDRPSSASFFAIFFMLHSFYMK